MTSVDLDLLAASLRADSSDIPAFVEGLARKLEDVMPAHVNVQRARRGLLGAKEVRAIAVDAGDRRLELRRAQGDVIEMRRGRVSGGIVIKTDTLDPDSWLRELGEAMTAEAQRSEHTRRAIERLLLD